MRSWAILHRLKLLHPRRTESGQVGYVVFFISRHSVSPFLFCHADAGIQSTFMHSFPFIVIANDQSYVLTMNQGLGNIRRLCRLWKRFLTACSPASLQRRSSHAPLNEALSTHRSSIAFCSCFLSPTTPPFCLNAAETPRLQPTPSRSL